MHNAILVAQMSNLCTTHGLSSPHENMLLSKHVCHVFSSKGSESELKSSSTQWYGRGEQTYGRIGTVGLRPRNCTTRLERALYCLTN